MVCKNRKRLYSRSNSRFVGTLLMQNERAEAEARFLKGITTQQSPAAMTTTGQKSRRPW